MQLEFDCIPCIYRQVLEASRMVTDNQGIIREILNEFSRMIPELESDLSAPVLVSRIQDYLKEVSGKKDPYYKFKEANLKLALNHYSDVEKNIVNAEDPLLAALIISAMGNSIDAGVSLKVDIAGNLARAVEYGFKYSDYQHFKKEVEKADRLLIIADNTGEAVFDRLLIRELDKFELEIIYAVRDKPILNDVTLKEARQLGIDKLCQLISSGCDTPGTVMERASEEFLNVFSEADIVISKGQGNLEGLMGTSRPIYYLLKIKCDLIASRLDSGMAEGDFIFKLM
ncbi:ARMT1-like domain-containing protein [Halocella sp. SP3-1]|uniref:damage-control phosphatase ARMT1 family protein n=1 Tax=Halocella sp. SP3-1 TaxID=2382161 RepID=UPI000F74E7B0|nr:ARMT1-like domain-containing protein [Halocella sp. SP3-1]AZO96009.1 DUF89 family protein [Halocella sp. SP3-1]